MKSILLACLLYSVIVAIAIFMHYEALYHLTTIISKLHIRRRYRVVCGVFGAVIAHVMEIWLFALVYFFLIGTGQFGTINGQVIDSLLDCVYFSFATYTSLGFGEIYPTGHLRFLAGLEALTGLVLITWTASFMFIEMQKFWKE